MALYARDGEEGDKKKGNWRREKGEGWMIPRMRGTEGEGRGG